MGYLGANFPFKMLWLSLSFLTYFCIRVTKEGTFFDILVVFLVTVPEALAHASEGQEYGLEIPG